MIPMIDHADEERDERIDRIAEKHYEDAEAEKIAEAHYAKKTPTDELTELLTAKKDFLYVKVPRSLLEAIIKEMAELSNAVEEANDSYERLKDDIPAMRHPDCV
jgi:YesN/AraC family two-component response regulator